MVGKAVGLQGLAIANRNGGPWGRRNAVGSELTVTRRGGCTPPSDFRRMLMHPLIIPVHLRQKVCRASPAHVVIDYRVEHRGGVWQSANTLHPQIIPWPPVSGTFL